ncbi:hypothetical protein E2C01_080187 [Portunus trituberculatus]|uniref:Uncharacterized protein n=1 Tax=Portunus trituberculatus TaxID=210409 RepID=A0A5B7ISH8_PORTR|nr:hypothetical protein [Portunus trituberculatus]
MPDLQHEPRELRTVCPVHFTWGLIDMLQVVIHTGCTSNAPRSSGKPGEPSEPSEQGKVQRFR